VLNYNKKISGKGNINTHNALKALSISAKAETKFQAYSFVEDIHQEMKRAFPQKTDYLGKENLTNLINEACTKARLYGFHTIRGQAMIVVLMFAFGHGCVNDPLYPWISQTLKDQKITDSDARSYRLEKKSITWLEHVLAGLKAEGLNA